MSPTDRRTVARFRCCITLAASAVLLSAGATLARDQASGPAAGTKLEPLKALVLTGSLQGKELDLAAERKDAPTLYIFIREFDRPVARYLKVLDGVLPQESAQAAAFAVWLTDEKAATQEYLPRVQGSLKLENSSLALYAGDKIGPDGWGLNPSARVTVVVANQGKAAASFGYMSINDTDVPAAREALKKAVAAK